jgi:hypothetical protein
MISDSHSSQMKQFIMHLTQLPYISNKQQLGLQQKGEYDDDDDDTEEMVRYLYHAENVYNNFMTLTNCIILP